MIPLNNTLSPVQVMIMDTLVTKPMTIKDVADETKVSLTYARIQVQRLEAAGRVTKVDNRTPYIYTVDKNDALFKYEALIKEYRDAFAGYTKSDSSVVNGILSQPKAEWPTHAGKLRAMAEAIDMLQAEGKLIDTL